MINPENETELKLIQKFVIHQSSRPLVGNDMLIIYDHLIKDGISAAILSNNTIKDNIVYIAVNYPILLKYMIEIVKDKFPLHIDYATKLATLI